MNWSAAVEYHGGTEPGVTRATQRAQRLDRVAVTTPLLWNDCLTASSQQPHDISAIVSSIDIGTAGYSHHRHITVHAKRTHQSNVQHVQRARAGNSVVFLASVVGFPPAQSRPQYVNVGTGLQCVQSPGQS